MSANQQYNCPDLVLIRGDILNPVVTKEEAGRLASHLLRFFSDADSFKKYVHVFNKEPRNFNLDELLKECP